MKRVLSPVIKKTRFFQKTWFFGRRVLRGHIFHDKLNFKSRGETIMIKKMLVFTLVVMCAFASSALADEDALNATQTVVAEDTLSATQTLDNGVVTVTITYTGKVNALGFKAFLPKDMSLTSVDAANAPDIKPDASDVKPDAKTGVTTLEFAWLTTPASPATFSYEVSGDGDISGEVLYRRMKDEIVVPAE
jgi:hypothetical protein